MGTFLVRIQISNPFSQLPEPGDSFGIGAEIPTESKAKEFVAFRTLQAEGLGFGVQLFQLCGIAVTLFRSFGEDLALPVWNSCLVKGIDWFPLKIPFRVQRPIGGDKDHRSKGGEIDRKLLQERLAVLHAVEIPLEAEHIENCDELLLFIPPLQRKITPQISFRDLASADNPFMVFKVRDAEPFSDLLPVGLERFVSRESPLCGGEL